MATDLYAEALAELRALRPKPVDTYPEPEQRSPEGCCTGDRRGYQWHQRTGNLPACATSKKASADYMKLYLRERSLRRKGGVS